MRDDIIGLHRTFEESSVLYGAQFSSLHHHHSELTDTLDRRFISFETCFDDLETRHRHDMQALSLYLDHHDERFTQFVESHARDQEKRRRDHREMMAYLRSLFPPPTP